jgi:hypothetical protein
VISDVFQIIKVGWTYDQRYNDATTDRTGSDAELPSACQQRKRTGSGCIASVDMLHESVPCTLECHRFLETCNGQVYEIAGDGTGSTSDEERHKTLSAFRRRRHTAFNRI